MQLQIAAKPSILRCHLEI